MHNKKLHGIDESDLGLEADDLQDLASLADLSQIHSELAIVHGVDDGITIIALEIVSYQGERLVSLLAPILQLE